MANEKLRAEIQNAGLRFWQIADKLGVYDSTLSKKFRHELSETEQTRIRAIIGELTCKSNRRVQAHERAGGRRRGFLFRREGRGGVRPAGAGRRRPRHLAIRGAAERADRGGKGDCEARLKQREQYNKRLRGLEIDAAKEAQAAARKAEEDRLKQRVDAAKAANKQITQDIKDSYAAQLKAAEDAAGAELKLYEVRKATEDALYQMSVQM